MFSEIGTPPFPALGSDLTPMSSLSRGEEWLVDRSVHQKVQSTKIVKVSRSKVIGPSVCVRHRRLSDTMVPL
jgi:hypothetical protein